MGAGLGHTAQLIDLFRGEDNIFIQLVSPGCVSLARRLAADDILATSKLFITLRRIFHNSAEDCDYPDVCLMLELVNSKVFWKLLTLMETGRVTLQ
jgi:hypothetical protein